MKYPRYPAYKDSGIEWLGVLPEGWAYSKIKFVSYVKGRVGWHGLNSQEFKDDGIHLVTGTDFESGKVNWETCYRISEERFAEDPYIHLLEDDLLITKDGTIGKLARVKNLPAKASLNSGIFVVRPLYSEYISDYLFWILSSGVFHQYFGLMQTGSTINHLYQEVFEEFAFPIPSTIEQRLITAFLDTETAQIDTLIAKQERLIALLQEKRQALISHAVTKGLNPDTPMKDSGVEWLGEVPAHWKIIPFGYLLDRIETGWTPNSEQRLADDDEWAVLKVGCIREGNFYQDEHKALAPSVEPDPTLEVHPGDLLMSRANTLELAGSVGLIETTRPYLTLSDKTFRLILKTDLLPSFANNLLQSRVARNQIELAATGASQSMKNISQSSVRALRLPIPPSSEQFLIVNHLNQEKAKIDVLLGKANRAIGLLQERRSALISAAVTGKIDVRAYTNGTPP